MLRHSFMPCSRSSTTRLPTSPRREAEYGRAGSAPSDIMELKDWRSPWTSSEKAALARSGEREPSRRLPSALPQRRRRCLLLRVRWGTVPGVLDSRVALRGACVPFPRQPAVRPLPLWSPVTDQF